jgi:hypothetical protein
MWAIWSSGLSPQIVKVKNGRDSSARPPPPRQVRDQPGLIREYLTPIVFVVTAS